MTQANFQKLQELAIKDPIVKACLEACRSARDDLEFRNVLYATIFGMSVRIQALEEELCREWHKVELLRSR